VFIVNFTSRIEKSGLFVLKHRTKLGGKVQILEQKFVKSCSKCQHRAAYLCIANLHTNSGIYVHVGGWVGGGGDTTDCGEGRRESRTVKGVLPASLFSQ
jgi:hypothetical protein